MLIINHLCPALQKKDSIEDQVPDQLFLANVHLLVVLAAYLRDALEELVELSAGGQLGLVHNLEGTRVPVDVRVVELFLEGLHADLLSILHDADVLLYTVEVLAQLLVEQGACLHLLILLADGEAILSRVVAMLHDLLHDGEDLVLLQLAAETQVQLQILEVLLGFLGPTRLQAVVLNGVLNYLVLHLKQSL